MSKRFKQFTLVSLGGLLLVLVVLALVFDRVNRHNLEHHYRDHNTVLARLLRNALVDAGLDTLLVHRTQWENLAILNQVDGLVRSHIKDLSVVKVKIYDRDGVTVYSSEKAQIGEDASANPGVEAALGGEPSSSIVHRNRFNSFDGVIEKRDLHQQYIPIPAPVGGYVQGAFEIYSDITPMMREISWFNRWVVLSLSLVLGFFFLGQLLLFYRTDRALAREMKQTQTYLHELEAARDELEQRVAERTAQLESSRLFLQSVIDGIANPLMVIRPDLQVAMINQAARVLMPAGTDPSEHSYCYRISHHCEEPCTVPDHPCPLDEVLQTGNTVRVRHTHYGPQGEPIIVDIASSPLRNGEGNMAGVIEVEHDVTELVRTQEGLAASEARLKAIMDHVPDAILTFDESGRIETANRVAERMFGEGRDALASGTVAGLICDDEASMLEIIGSTLRGKGVLETCALRKGEEPFPAELWVGELYLTERRLFIAVVRDISERKRAEQELEQTRKKYQYQEKMAAIGQLAAGILHEVGNPIAAIAGASQEMRETLSQRFGEDRHRPPDLELTRNLGLIEAQTQRLGKITRDIADFASPRPGERELLDLNGLIRSTARLLGYDRRFRDVTVDLALDRNLPAVNGVADQLTQVLMNLLINAMDATRAQEGQSGWVRVVSRPAGAHVEISVEDNGVGMDASTARRACEPFFTTKPVGKGTGLGLSLCESLISAHGGTLRIDSTPGRGTTVSVALPLEVEDDRGRVEVAVS